MRSDPPGVLTVTRPSQYEPPSEHRADTKNPTARSKLTDWEERLILLQPLRSRSPDSHPALPFGRQQNASSLSFIGPLRHPRTSPPILSARPFFLRHVTPLMRSPSTLLALLLSLWSLVASAQVTSQHAPIQPALVNRTPAPQPSRRMGLKSRSPAGGKKGQQILSSGGRKDYSAFLCPDNAIACPVPASGAVLAGVKEDELADLATWFKVGFECIEPLEELSSCGGCISLGRG